MRCAGIEGAGSYGAELTRYLRAAPIPVTEVERPKRRHLRRSGKSDPIDAELAAWAMLAGETAKSPVHRMSFVGWIDILSLSETFPYYQTDDGVCYFPVHPKDKLARS